MHSLGVPHGGLRVHDPHINAMTPAHVDVLVFVDLSRAIAEEDIHPGFFESEMTDFHMIFLVRCGEHRQRVVDWATANILNDLLSDMPRYGRYWVKVRCLQSNKKNWTFKIGSLKICVLDANGTSTDNFSHIFSSCS